ncbi:MAG: 2-dehydropantoate 2-reductase [Bacillota bacterium]|nr:2-dehydropantoate 2-reductase [Bacillota bacterium]
MMKIGIIGAGSIGLLFASHLSQICPVVIYTRTKEQAKVINENGIVLWKGNRALRMNVKAMTIDEWAGDEQLNIIAVKQYHLENILSRMKEFKKKIENLLFLQNGMGHLKLLSGINANHIFVGSIEHGANKENSFTVRHNGEGITNLALFKGDRDSLFEIVSLFPPSFPVKLHENYYEMLLNKLIINAVINPMTAILQVKNGELINNPYYLQVLKDLYLEISCIMHLKDVEGNLQKIIQVCQNTSENRSSMFKDIEGGRKTEVEAILGFLLEEKEKDNQKAPLITSFYHLIRGKEKGIDENG